MPAIAQFALRRAAVVLLVLSATASVAAEGTSRSPGIDDDLSRRQERIASKYAQLEELMLKMAQLEAAQNPRRAALLNQAIAASKEKRTKLQLETIADLLGKKQLSRAIKEQVDAGKSLEALLLLLQSEDRSQRIKSEQERIKEYIKEVERMIRLERSLQGQNEGGADAERLAQEQAKLADRAAELSQKIKENEESQSETKSPESNPSDKPPTDQTKPEDQAKPEKNDQPPGDQKPSESKPSPSKPSESKPSEAKPGEQKPEDSKNDDSQPSEEKPNENPDASKPDESKPSESKPGESKPSESKPGESKPSESKPSESKPSESTPMPTSDSSEQSPSNSPQQQNPVREKIDQARQRMKAAQQKLQEANRKESAAEQEKAREELEKAKAELEKILRQLREEEMERTLAALETRFRKMLEMQVKVYEGTKKLDAIPADERTREVDVLAGRLGGDEAKIALEAEKALQLLQEEGSSVAFPTTVDLLIDDMRQTSERLNAGKVDTITQGLEEEIIANLEELLEALKQAQQKLEEQKQQQQQQNQQQSGQQEQPLVDAIQELKMIKSLQLRVNKRTDRYAKLLQNADDPVGQANTKELLEALDKLSERQKQVFEIVREIVLGKNR